MAKDKKSVLLYCDIIHTIKSLTNEEAGKLFKHYLDYINDLNPKSDRLTELLFEPIKQNLKRDLKKWESKSERNSLIAKKGWVKRKGANACERTKADAKNAVKDKVTVKDKEINIPTINEFLDYCKTIKEFRFVDYKFSLENKYHSWKDNKWRDGHNTPIKNWKTKIRGTYPYLSPVKNTVPNNINSGLI